MRSSDMTKLEKELYKMLAKLYDNKSVEAKEKLVMLFKLIVQTRDVVQGKGERDIAYMQLPVWYSYYPNKLKSYLNCLYF